MPLLDAETLAELIAIHRGQRAAATIVTTTLPNATGYGRILRTQDGEVIAIVEETDATRSSAPSARSTPVSTPSTSANCGRR